MAADASVRIVPNEALYRGPGGLSQHLGELAQCLHEVEPRLNLSSQIDASARIREGEVRAGGATPLEAVSLFLVVTAADTTARLFARQLDALADRCFEATIAWVKRNRAAESPEEVAVTLYGPNGEALRSVLVESGGTIVERSTG